MKNEKVFILLFPQKEYLGTFQNCTTLFNECIRKRYLDHGYAFYVVKYKNSDLGIVTETPTQTFDADITFEASSPKTLKDWRYADFKFISENLPIEDCSQIVIGGFHCYDCVEKLANEIYSLNKNVLVDTDLTEQFDVISQHQNNWDIKTFQPEQKLERLFTPHDFTPSGILKNIKARFENPIWGISPDTITKLDKKLQHQLEDENEFFNK